MMKSGWRPRRTVACSSSWDGEEQGLLGSTEWVEDLQTELRAKTAVYVNRDAGASGTNFNASAVHSLTPFVYDSRAGDSARTRRQTVVRRVARPRAPSRRTGAAFLKAPPVGALGSGSDYTAFLDHLGIASLDFGLNGRGDSGTYHSTYDHPGWFKTFIDPHFTNSVLAARVTGVAVLRLADAEVLPLDYEAYGRQVAGIPPRHRAAGRQSLSVRCEDDRLRRSQTRGDGVHEGGRIAACSRRRNAVQVA